LDSIIKKNTHEAMGSPTRNHKPKNFTSKTRN
jgi:hypothetical protein